MIHCRDCNLAEVHGIHGVYTLKCAGCRLRILMDEPCKVMREILAQGIKKWGELPEYKIEPNCGCKKVCERRQSIRALNTDKTYAN